MRAVSRRQATCAFALVLTMAGCRGAGAGSGSAQARFHFTRRTGDHRRRRSRQQRSVHRRPEERRFRGPGRRRPSESRLVLADPRRPQLQHRGAAARSGRGRHPAPAGAAGQRMRQAASSSSSSTTCTSTSATPGGSGSCSRNLRGAGSRRRHVRHRLHGPSSIAIDPTYDRRRLAEAIKKISGAGLAPKDILDVPQGQQGPPEVRHRAHVAFSTA